MVLSHGFKNLHTFKIPGIGVNTERLILVDEEKKQSLRKEYGYRSDDFLMIYIAEYIPRKNHKFLIDTIPDLLKIAPKAKYLFAGRGRDMESTKQYAIDRGVADHIDFLGFRNDIGQLIALSDIGVSASKQEGLPMNIAEEMFAGKPVIASMDRGHKEMVVNGENGYLYNQGNKEEFLMAISSLYNNHSQLDKMGAKACEDIQKFRLENSIAEMEKIYNQFL
jgi:glycosyltransferase EpsD